MNSARIKRIISVLLKTLIPVFGVFLIALYLYVTVYKPLEDPEYGVTFSYKYAASLGLNWKEVYIGILDDLKVNKLRLVAYWDDIEKQDGFYDFSNVDYMLAEAKKRNVSVILTIGRKVPRWPECHEPAWIKSRTKDFIRQKNLDLVKKEVEHFSKFDNIKYWQVENEPLFPFGECSFWIGENFLKQEVDIVRSLDNRPIIISDSGEGGFWTRSYKLADFLGISMYRNVYMDVFGYFKYPIPPWGYKLKALLLNIPIEKVINTELQMEPWTDTFVLNASQQEQDKTMTHAIFWDTLNYSKRSGIKTTYLWGVEWWYYKKANKDPFYWETSKILWTQKQ